MIQSFGPCRLPCVKAGSFGSARSIYIVYLSCYSQYSTKYGHLLGLLAWSVNPILATTRAWAGQPGQHYHALLESHLPAACPLQSQAQPVQET